MENADSADNWRHLLTDPAVTGEALRALAVLPDVPVEALACLAADERRLKETPAIATAIYTNRRAPLSVANRAVVTCHRLGVVPEGIPGFEELAQAIAADPTALDAAVNSGFDDLLQTAPEANSAEIDVEVDTNVLNVDTTTDTDPDKAAAQGPDTPSPPGPASSAKGSKRRSAIIDFTRLKLYEKIRLATLGNAYCRQNLLRDSNRMVAMAAIRSPQITDGEIVKAAGNRALSEEVIRYIGNRKELVKQYAVKLALVGNAKCPLAVTLRLLSTLNADDIKQIARSKNVPGALSTAAKRLAAAKGPQ
ncbi:MAG: hypothetical protein H7X95_14165 [Deltaproteobacteria bacterium]|nr:hypothetical protein [Deltaproteobacteria bacterium]